MRLSASAFILFASLALAAPASADDPAAFANPVKFIAQAVDGVVRYDPGAANLSGMELIEYATRNDPTLPSPFRGSGRYKLDARRDGKLSAVLLCDGDTALFEDAGCTGPMDWNGVSQPRPCGFALDLPQVCKRPVTP